MTLTRPHAALPLLVLALSACGGSTSETIDPVTVAPVSYTLGGGETSLDTTNADRVLAAALATLASASNLDASSLLQVDNGNAAPGAGRRNCSTGTLTESVSTGGGTRNVSLTGDQCYILDGGSEFLQDGTVGIDLSSGGGGLFGTVSLGGGLSDPLSLLTRDRGDAVYTYAQLVGDVAFDGETDLSPITASTGLTRLIIGVGTPTRTGTPFTPERGFELRVGNSSTDFQVISTANGSGRRVDVSGPVSIAGTDLDLECNFTARYLVVTDVTVPLDASGVARGGQLRIAPTSGSGSATVQFDVNGAALVTTSDGRALTYTASQVDSFCGL